MNGDDASTHQQPSSTSKRRPRGWLVLLVVFVAGGAVAIKYGRHHVFPKRFAEVVPGCLYRSGQLERRPLQDVIDRYHLRTILVLLNDEADDADAQAEKAIAAEKGIQLVRIGMPGNGVAEFDLLEQAAAVLADAKRYPVLVHCAGGVNRTGAVYAVWRMKYQGWDVERALAEAVQQGSSPSDNPALQEHLRRYYRERMVPATQPSNRPGGP